MKAMERWFNHCTIRMSGFSTCTHSCTPTNVSLHLFTHRELGNLSFLPLSQTVPALDASVSTAKACALVAKNACTGSSGRLSQYLLNTLREGFRLPLPSFGSHDGL